MNTNIIQAYKDLAYMESRLLEELKLLINYGKDCNCVPIQEEKFFDLITYPISIDSPEIERYCLICGGYKFF